MLFKNFCNYNLEAGCDEVGRGCLAGPVVAAAVILPKKFQTGSLKDSKQLSSKERLLWDSIIREEAVDWAIGFAMPDEIDKMNILNASHLAMHRAIAKLNVLPTMLLIDGKHFQAHETIKHQCIIRGDERVNSIAAASILAKVYRDKYMRELDIYQPGYNWEVNKGYPTIDHQNAIQELGLTSHHRKSFRYLAKEKNHLHFNTI